MSREARVTLIVWSLFGYQLTYGTSVSLSEEGRSLGALVLGLVSGVLLIIVACLVVPKEHQK